MNITHNLQYFQNMTAYVKGKYTCVYILYSDHYTQNTATCNAEQYKG